MSLLHADDPFAVEQARSCQDADANEDPEAHDNRELGPADELDVVVAVTSCAPGGRRSARLDGTNEGAREGAVQGVDRRGDVEAGRQVPGAQAGGEVLELVAPVVPGHLE